MAARFHVPAARASGEVLALPEEEAAHLTRVLRLGCGDAVRVFNGLGLEFDAVVAGVESGRVTVRLGEAATPAREPRAAVTLVQAVLKGDKMDDVVRDAVMLGVGAIHPVLTAHTEVTGAALARGQRTERWQRIAVSSAKQCGRATVPPVFHPFDFEGLVAALADASLPAPAIMFVEPQAGVSAAKMADLGLEECDKATVIVGPEGGWTAAEIARAMPVVHFATLGGRTFRADAAAVVALSALLTALGEF